MRRILNILILGIISASFLLAIPEINFIAQPASGLLCVTVKGTQACLNASGTGAPIANAGHIHATPGAPVCGGKQFAFTHGTGPVCAP